jgi:hypothetical protein
MRYDKHHGLGLILCLVCYKCSNAPFDSLSQIDYVLECDNAMFKHLVVNILKCPILQEFYVNGFLTTPY